ncbi:unnamed protein product [Sphagnum troendelagicum]|jgi:hypothetical protein
MEPTENICNLTHQQGMQSKTPAKETQRYVPGPYGLRCRIIVLKNSGFRVHTERKDLLGSGAYDLVTDKKQQEP